MLLQVSWLGTGTNKDREKKIPSPGCSLFYSHDRISVDSNFVLCVRISRPVSVAASCF